MAIASITTWLISPNPNYHHGRMLYEQYGDNKLVLTIIKSGSSSYHYGKLREAMELLNQKTNIEPKPIVFKEPVAQVSNASEVKSPGQISKVKTNLDDAPPEIRAIRDRKNLNYAIARHLHLNIKLMDSAEHRLNASLELLNKMDDVNECWVAMDEWAKSGKIIELQKEETEKQISELTLQQLIREENNLPSYISKARKRYNEAKDPRKKTKALAKVHSLTTRLSEVKRRLYELV